MRSRDDNGQTNKPLPIHLLPDTGLQAKLVRWSRYLIAIVLAIALLVLAGWAFNLEFLKHPFGRTKAMNPLTSLLFIFSSISFLVFHTRRRIRDKATAAVISAGIVGLVAIIKLIDVITGAGWEIDHILFTQKMQNEAFDSMATNTAVCLLLGALSLLGCFALRRIVAGQVMALLIGLIGWLSILGYLYQAESFYSMLSYTPMALYSAICFVCLGLALLFMQPGEGIMPQFTSALSGSVTAKLLVPVAVLVPTLLGLLRLQGHWLGMYDVESGVALYTLVIIIIFLGLSWYITFVLNTRDVHKKKTEDAVRRHEQEIAAIFKAAPDAIIVIDNQSRIMEWNREAEILFGWESKEVTGRLLTETIIPGQYQEHHRRGMLHFLQTGESRIIGQTVELQAIKKNKTTVDIALRVAQVPVNDTLYFVGFLRDITEEKKTAQKLKSFNEELGRRVVEKTKETSEVLERLNDGFIALDRNFCYTYMNKKAGDMTHKDPMEMIGKNIWEEFPEAIGSPTYLAICKAMSDQQYTSNTDYYEPLDLWQENYIYPSPNGVSIFIKDITQRKKDELRLEESHKLADKLIDSLPGVFYFYDENGKFIRWNSQFETVTGYTAKEIAGMHPTQFFDANEQGYIAERIKGVFDNGENDAEANFLTKSGQKIPYYFKAVLITYGGKLCLLGFGIDVTERKIYEEQLISSEHKYKLLFQNNPLPMWMLSLPDYTVIDVNNATLDQYGYSRNEFLALDIAELRPEEDREKFKSQTHTGFRDVIYHAGIWRHKRKDGSIIYVDIITYDIYYEGKPARFVLANNITEKYNAEEKLKESYESIRRLTEHLQKIREEERTHIAREIHDELGQQLTVMKMDMAWLNKKTDAKDEALKQKIGELLTMIDLTVKTVRRIASELRPSLLDDLGLVAAMEWHLQEFTKRSGVVTIFQGPESDMPLPDDIKIGLFRILQESLTNVARHARAKEVRVVFEEHENEVILTITDDGVGFGKENVSKKTLGILGMKERAEMMGGQYNMTSYPGKGTTISVTIPLKTHQT